MLLMNDSSVNNLSIELEICRSALATGSCSVTYRWTIPKHDFESEYRRALNKILSTITTVDNVSWQSIKRRGLPAKRRRFGRIGLVS